MLSCMCKEAGGGEGGGEARDTESKTRTPHKDVGNKNHHPPVGLYMRCLDAPTRIAETWSLAIKSQKNTVFYKSPGWTVPKPA